MWRWGLVVVALVVAGAVGCAAPAPPAPAGAGPGAASSAQPTAGAGAAAQPAPAPAVARTALTLGLNAVSASATPLWLAKDAGIFDKYGFDVEFITLASSSQVAKVMASGEMPISLSAAAGVVDAGLAGDEQILISGIQNTMNFWVYSRPDITRVADLRGKKIGTTAFGSGAHLGAIRMLRSAGLEPDRDAAIIQVGGMPQMHGALVAGAIDAGVLSIPWNFQAHDDGMYLLDDIAAQRFPYLQTGVATTRGYLAQNEELVRRFMMAHVEGLARMHTDRATTIDVLLRNLKSDDRALMERTYDLIEPLFERIPYPTAASIQSVIDQRAAENPDAAKLTPAQVSDDRFVRELETSGFIGRLYQ